MHIFAKQVFYRGEVMVVVPSPQLTAHIVKEFVLISIYLNIFRLTDTLTKVLLNHQGRLSCVFSKFYKFMNHEIQNNF